MSKLSIAKQVGKYKAPKKQRCPMCKQMVPPEWITKTPIPLVKNGRRMKRLAEARLAECCATLFLEVREP